ncbi:MAG TPA: hypothetical protein VM123_02010 [archaeon]|nr:hypothetical protein [archaeon]
MHWYEVFSYLFVITVIVLIAVGAIKAFSDFYRGRHHEESK